MASMSTATERCSLVSGGFAPIFVFASIVSVVVTTAILWCGCTGADTLEKYPPTYQKGFNLYFLDYPNVYDSVDFERTLERLAGNGVNSVYLIPHHFSRTETSDSIFRTSRTISRSCLTSAIAQCQRMGLRVALKPHINLDNDRPRYSISPTHEEIWQTQYLSMLSEYIDLSNEKKLSMLVVATELDGIADRPLFRQMLRRIRDVYKGDLVYSSTYDFFIGASIWPYVDQIGVNAYFCLSNTDDPPLTTLLRQWSDRLSLLSSFGQRQGKPVIITEVGYCSQHGCFKNPGDWTLSKQVNLDHQASCYEALLAQASHYPAIHGIYWWHWRLNNKEGVSFNDLDYTPQGKPAERIVRKHWTDE